MEAIELFEDTMRWLHANYSSFRFFVERDLVWAVQNHLIDLIKENNLPYQVFNEYPMRPGKGRRQSADLAIVDAANEIQLAIEFKYEPSRNRDDVLASRFPVVFWRKDGVGQDLEKVRNYVESGLVKCAYFVFVDEGGWFRNRSAHPGSQWIDWDAGVSLLVAKVVAPLPQILPLDVFINDEAGYLSWLKQNPGGYIINTTRGMNPKYMVLHKAKCTYISQYSGNAKQGGFTERDYIKICAQNISDLKEWVRQHGRADGSFSGYCPCTNWD